jgi:hypothetical protein
VRPHLRRTKNVEGKTKKKHDNSRYYNRKTCVIVE